MPNAYAFFSCSYSGPLKWILFLKREKKFSSSLIMSRCKKQKAMYHRSTSKHPNNHITNRFSFRNPLARSLHKYIYNMQDCSKLPGLIICCSYVNAHMYIPPPACHLDGLWNINSIQFCKSTDQRIIFYYAAVQMKGVAGVSISSSPLHLIQHTMIEALLLLIVSIESIWNLVFVI